MDTRDEDDEIIPEEFLGYPERYGLQYRHTLSGAALILGGFGVFLGSMLATGPVEPGDRTIGIVLIAIGVPLLILSPVAYKRQRRQADERYLRYLEWKRVKKGASGGADSRQTDGVAAGGSVGGVGDEGDIIPSKSPKLEDHRRFDHRSTLPGFGFIVGIGCVVAGGLFVLTSGSPENRWGAVVAAAGVLVLTLSYMGYMRQGHKRTE